MIAPSLVTMLEPQTGTGNMGDVTDVSSVARFSLPNAERYVLAVVRALFTSGTGSADLFIRTDHRRGSLYDFKTAKFASMGTTVNDRLEYRVAEDELYHHVYLKDFGTGVQDAIVFEWTNPDSGTMRWSLEVGVIDAASIGR